MINPDYPIYEMENQPYYPLLTTMSSRCAVDILPSNRLLGGPRVGEADLPLQILRQQRCLIEIGPVLHLVSTGRHTWGAFEPSSVMSCPNKSVGFRV